MDMQFSLFFFGADSKETDPYRLLFESVRYAESSGFTAVWVPERHFTRFGGLYGSPSVTAAALAATTSTIGIRAGSVVLPLHHPLGIAEEWSMIDNISKGRVGIAAACGWHVNDFILAPSNYEERRQVMFETLDVVRRLWRGDAVSFVNGSGRAVEVRIFPSPVQVELPIWLTTSSEQGSRTAGKCGFNLLTSNYTHGYSLENLGRCLSIYREQCLLTHGTRGHVTLMLHTFVGHSSRSVEQVAVPAMERYLDANIELQQEQDSGTGVARGYANLQGRRREGLQMLAARRNAESDLSLVGVSRVCRRRIAVLERLGVDEIACLIDFGIPLEHAMSSLERLARIIKRA